MKSENPRIPISFKNTIEDIILYEYVKGLRDKSNYIKNLIEKDMFEQKKKSDLKG